MAPLLSLCIAAGASGDPTPGSATGRRRSATGGQHRSSKAAITVYRPRDEVERLWSSSEYRPQDLESVVFKDAPGDRGTEIHVDVGRSWRARVARAKAKDALRRFKQHVETGEIPRSDATPDGERVERKLKQRPAQPLKESELEKAGAR